MANECYQCGNCDDDKPKKQIDDEIYIEEIFYCDQFQTNECNWVKFIPKFVIEMFCWLRWIMKRIIVKITSPDGSISINNPSDNVFELKNNYNVDVTSGDTRILTVNHTVSSATQDTFVVTPQVSKQAGNAISIKGDGIFSEEPPPVPDVCDIRSALNVNAAILSNVIPGGKFSVSIYKNTTLLASTAQWKQPFGGTVPYGYWWYQMEENGSNWITIDKGSDFDVYQATIAQTMVVGSAIIPQTVAVQAVIDDAANNRFIINVDGYVVSLQQNLGPNSTPALPYDLPITMMCFGFRTLQSASAATVVEC